MDGKAFAWVDANYHDSEKVLSGHVSYVDEVAQPPTTAAEAEAEEDESDESEESALLEVAGSEVGEEGGNDNGIYYDAANMPSWLVPPWVSQNAPTGMYMYLHLRITSPLPSSVHPRPMLIE